MRTAEPLFAPATPSAELLDALFQIERLRGRASAPSGHSVNSLGLHAVYSRLAGVASARIEGNRTTVADALAARPAGGAREERLREIDNLDAATRWVMEQPRDRPITHSAVRQLHEQVVHELVREGDDTPGAYRTVSVRIEGAAHAPPAPLTVHAHMDAVIDALNAVVAPRNQIAHIAATHHRFAWVHPFTNGNGRVARLLTLWQLRVNGFSDVWGLPLSPTAVFGRARLDYYEALAAADSLTDAGLTQWIEFFAAGIVADMSRLAALQDHEFATTAVMAPALESARFAGVVTPLQTAVVMAVWDRGVVKAGDLEPYIPGSPAIRSQKIRTFLDAGLLESLPDMPRHYRVALLGSPITPHVLRALERGGLIPELLRD